MSFNLVQEEVIANVKNVARQLGILKEEETDYWLATKMIVSIQYLFYINIIEYALICI